MMETLWQDLRYGARQLARSPGFTAVAVLTLALGIGANTAMFALIHAVLLRPLPFGEPDRLAMLWERRGGSRDANIPVSGHEFMAWRERSRVFEQVALYGYDTRNLTGSGEPESLRVLRVSADFFPLLGVKPTLGRVFLPGEDRSGHSPVVILSDGFWRRRFGAEDGIVGRSIILNDEAHTVIGVMPPFPQSLTPDIWLPIDVPGEAQKVGRHSLMVIARLKPDVTLPQAQSDLDGIAQALERELPQSNTDHHVRVVPLRDDLVGSLRPAFRLLFAAVGFVLLIACVNVANLLLTRAAGRQKETAIRIALGASRRRLIGQSLVESLMFAGLGGGVGLLLAVWIIDSVPAITTISIPLLDTARFDGPVLGVALALSLLTGLATGLVPAIRSSRPRLAYRLNEGGRMSDEPSRRRLRAALVASEVALALVLLVGAGLMMRSFIHLVTVDPGFNPQNVLVMNVSLPGTRYAQPELRKAFIEQLLARIRSLPGVEAAGGTTNLPLGGGDNWMPVSIEGRPAPAPGQELYAPTRVVTPDYFRALEIPLRGGRFFSDADARMSLPLVRWYAAQPFPPNFDKPQAPPVAIISEAMARQYWPNENPIGRRFRLMFSPAVTVVGVVGDVKHNALDGPSYPHIYIPHTQEPWGEMAVVVRTSGQPMQYAASVRQQVRGLDADLPVAFSSMSDVFSDSIGRQRFTALLIGIFGALALGLAVVGIFGLVSYAAAQRTREIGVRMALGAQPGHILKLVVGQGMTPVLAGVVLGACGALALSRFIEGLLFGVKPADPLTFAGVTVLLTAAALLACYIPARRAMRVDPMVALRYE